MTVKHFFKYGLSGLGPVLILIQFVPVDRDNPPVKSELVAPPEVKAVLRESCYDCHSNETVWPWYSHVAPISWMIIRDIHRARDEYNLSEWELMDPEKQSEIREEMWEMASEGRMPPLLYRLAHPEARVSGEELAVLRLWLLADVVDGEKEGGQRRRRRRRGRDR